MKTTNSFLLCLIVALTCGCGAPALQDRTPPDCIKRIDAYGVITDVYHFDHEGNSVYVVQRPGDSPTIAVVPKSHTCPACKLCAEAELVPDARLGTECR